MLKRNLILCWFLFFKVSAQPIEILLDDKTELKVFLGNNPPSEIFHSTNTLLFESLGLPLKYSYMSFKRSFELINLEKENVVCKINKIQTSERKKNYLFSLPVSIYLGIRLYQNSDSKPLNTLVFNGSDEILSLHDIFKYHETSVISVMGGVSYTEYLDRQLSHIPEKNKHVVPYYGTSTFNVIFQLLSKKRSDFILAYPADIYRKNRDLEDDFRSYSISGNNEYVTGHLMCNKSEQAYIFIQKINKILIELYESELFIESHIKYLSFNERPHLESILKRLTNNNNAF